MGVPERILEVRGLSISFSQYTESWHKGDLRVIRDLDVSVGTGELVAVVGSSGSGKSLLAHGVLDLLPYNASVEGEILYRGEPLTPQRARALRGKEIVLVPQSVNYLDPLMRIGPQLRGGKGDRGAAGRVRAALSRYGLGDDVERRYPFELSGGMARRVLIASAVLEQPDLVIADEPTPGLHLDIARRVLGHLRELADAGAGVLLITHDLELALAVADRIAVFYAGATVELARSADFEREETLRHPYTRALWRAMPRNGFRAVPGAQPYPGELGTGCPFLPRCEQAGKDCAGEIPMRAADGGWVRCLHPCGGD